MGEDDRVTTGLTRVLAEADPSKTGSIGPGLTAFVIVGLLFVATGLLVVSMLRQIKKVPPTFEEPAGPAAAVDEDPAGP
jgi:hypothetical protein